MGTNEIHNLNHAQSLGVGHAARRQTGDGVRGFEELIQERARNKLNFSKHATKRLDERGIVIDNRLLGDLEHAVDEARKEGSKGVAVIGSKGMFIVNVPNNTVVTTMSRDDMGNRIFTNIDSAVFMWAGPEGGPASCLKCAGRNSRKESVC